MRRRAVTALIAIAVAACQDGPAPPYREAGSSDAPASTDAGNAGDSGAATDAGGDATIDAGADADSGPAVTFVDVADTPCQSLATDAGTVLVQGPGAPRFVDLGAVSTRRFAGSEDTLVTFDTTGQNASALFSPAFVDFVTSSSEGTDVAVASLNSGAVGFTRYDASGSVVLATQTVQSTTPAGDPALAIGSRAGASLIVWRQGTNLRGVEYATSAGTPVDFGSGTFGTSVDVAVGASTNGYAVAWTGDSGGGTWGLRFTVWGSTSQTTSAYAQSAPMHVVRLVPAAGGSGWAAVVNSDYPQQGVLLVPLDASGNVSGAIHRYLGAAYAWSVASSASGYAIVARRASNEPEWRSLTTSGDAQSAWVCLDGSLGNQIGGAGVDSDGALWATVFSTANGGADFVRLDTNGAPQ